MHTCSSACVQNWTPGRKSHCTACGETFTTPANFDKHRVHDKCIKPVNAGLVKNKRGEWMKAGEVDYVQRFSR